MSVLALDLASTTGFAFGEPGARPRSGSISFGSGEASRGRRMYRCQLWLHEFLKVEPVSEIAYEAPLPQSFSRGKTTQSTALLLIGLTGVVEAVAFAHGVRRVVLHPLSSVRAHFIGRGNLPGKDAKRLVQARCLDLGWSYDDHNAADALALWDYHCHRSAPAATALPFAMRRAC